MARGCRTVARVSGLTAPYAALVDVDLKAVLFFAKPDSLRLIEALGLALTLEDSRGGHAGSTSRS
jgi:hypothetical protein